MSEEIYTALAVDNSKFTPTFEPSRGRKWVGWGHKGQNNYPTMLLDLMKNSSLHGMIIKSKANTVSGQGFERVDETEIEGAQKDFMEDADGRGTSIKKIMDSTDLDEVIFGQRALLVTWNSTWDKIIHASYRPAMNFRPFSELDEFGDITGYIYSANWTKRQPYQPKYIPVFSTGKAREIKKQYDKAFADVDKKELDRIDKESRTQVIMGGSYLPDSVFFGVPFYGAATMVIKSDIESDKFAYNSLEGRLAAQYIIEIDGITDPILQNSTAKRLLARHTGAIASGKPLITFTNTDGKGSVRVIPIETKGADKILTEVNIKTQQKILSAHGITSPTLVGIAPSGGLGNSSDLGKLYDLYQANIISPMQARRDEMINKINKVNGWPLLQTVLNINVFAEQETDDTTEVVEEIDEANK